MLFRSHQLRAHTPNDAKALKQTVATFPRSDYDLAEVLQQLGIGEAVVTVMDPDGAPTPVAWTRMIAPRSLMAPTPEDVLRPGVAMSALMKKYGQAIDRDSAQEMLARKLEQGAAAAQQEQEQAERVKQQDEADKQAAKERTAAARQQPRASQPRASSRQPKGTFEQIVSSPLVKSFAGQAGREIIRGLFGSARRRR